MAGMRRKNIREKQRQEVRTLHFEEGLTVEAIFKHYEKTSKRISESSIYDIIAKARKATGIQPHHRMLRSLTERWLQEIRELNPIKLAWQYAELMLSAGGLLDLVQKADVKENLEIQEAQPDARVSIGRWRTIVQKDLLFHSLEEHLAGYSLWQRYEEVGQATHEIYSTLSNQVYHHVRFLICDYIDKITDETWVERLQKDAGLREVISLLARHAFRLASLELTRLAIRDHTSSTELESLKWVVDRALSDTQHKMELDFSSMSSGSWSDQLLDSVRTGWADNEWDEIKTAITRTIDLLFKWEKAKDMLVKDLEALTYEDSFPGKCDDCP